MMKKPKKKKKEILDYHECEIYIANKLKVKDLEDFAGRWDKKFGTPEFENTPYLNFWHYIIKICDIDNPCEFYMPLSQDNDNKEFLWVNPILDAFRKEFGEGPYWVEW